MNQAVTVLLVGESPVSFELVERTMEKEFSFTVLAAPDATEGMEKAEAHLPAIIMCDIDALGGHAASFCRRVKTHSVLRESILMIVRPRVETRENAEQCEADDYIARPISLREFVARFHSALRIKSLQDQVNLEKEELAGLNQQLEDGFQGVLRLITQVIGLRVPGASARAERAGSTVRWIGQKLHLEHGELRQLEIAALLHELGKISLSDEMLRNDRNHGAEQERQVFNQYPVLGQMLIAGIPQLVTVSHYIRHQLENYDGSGYPDRLMKGEIPLPSRILRAVNVLEEFNASHARTQMDQMQFLRRIQGTILEPQIVQLLTEYITVTEDPDWMKGKMQLNVEELAEGMVLAADIVTGSGVKLLPKDSTLSALLIRRILTHQVSDPIINAIYVYEPSKVLHLRARSEVAL